MLSQGYLHLQRHGRGIHAAAENSPEKRHHREPTKVRKLVSFMSRASLRSIPTFIHIVRLLTSYFSMFDSWLAKTNPADVARVEKRTFISTDVKNDTIPTPRKGTVGELGNWISPHDMDEAILERFPGCMKG